ncbi:hypothetical protein M404DRAFT_1008165, partial [Pisolithus tinctorius Marx 270]
MAVVLPNLLPVRRICNKPIPTTPRTVRHNITTKRVSAVQGASTHPSRATKYSALPYISGQSSASRTDLPTRRVVRKTSQ